MNKLMHKIAEDAYKDELEKISTSKYNVSSAISKRLIKNLGKIQKIKGDRREQLRKLIWSPIIGNNLDQSLNNQERKLSLKFIKNIKKQFPIK
jgi:hypothetical protein